MFKWFWTIFALGAPIVVVVRQFWLACYCRGVILAASCLFDDHDCEISKLVKTSVNCGVRVLRERSARASHARRACEHFWRLSPVWLSVFQPPSRPFVWLLARTWIRKIRTVLQSKGLFRWRWRTLGRWGNPLRWGNLPVHIISHFNVITFTC